MVILIIGSDFSSTAQNYQKHLNSGGLNSNPYSCSNPDNERQVWAKSRFGTFSPGIVTSKTCQNRPVFKDQMCPLSHIKISFC